MVATTTSPLVTVFGGSGFIGTYVVRALAKRGYKVRVAVRRPDLAVHLQPMGAVGQIQAVQANLRFEESVRRAVKGADIAINLVGVLASSGSQSFGALHARGAEVVARACREQGIRRLVHMSALGSDPDSASQYARTKAEGEAAVREIMKENVIFRPSVVFGPEDNFFNQFARMAQMSPFLPLIGGGRTRFQPVYVGDVAEAFALAADGDVKPRRIYELGGPEIMTLREIFDYICKETRRSPAYLPIPWPVATAMGMIGGLIPGKPLTEDQVRLLKSDNVVSEQARKDGRTLEGLGITPTAAEAVVPEYLYAYRRGGQFADSSTGMS